MSKVLVHYMMSALNMDTPNIFKSYKYYQHMALRVREEKQLKNEFIVESAKQRVFRQFEGNLCFPGALIVITGKFKFLLDMITLL